MDVELISPVPGFAPHKEDSKHYSPPHEKELKERLATRREEQETDEWKKRYAKRSGIEGLNRALDQVTGFKKSRVRGLQAVEMALYLKAAGWNILAAVKIHAHRARKKAATASAATAGLFAPHNGPFAPAARYLFFLCNNLAPREDVLENTPFAA